VCVCNVGVSGGIWRQKAWSMMGYNLRTTALMTQVTLVFSMPYISSFVRQKKVWRHTIQEPRPLLLWLYRVMFKHICIYPQLFVVVASSFSLALRQRYFVIKFSSLLWDTPRSIPTISPSSPRGINSNGCCCRRLTADWLMFWLLAFQPTWKEEEKWRTHSCEIKTNLRIWLGLNFPFLGEGVRQSSDIGINACHPNMLSRLLVYICPLPKSFFARDFLFLIRFTISIRPSRKPLQLSGRRFKTSYREQYRRIEMKVDHITGRLLT
jgi:hypothetical protein